MQWVQFLPCASYATCATNPAPPPNLFPISLGSASHWLALILEDSFDHLHISLNQKLQAVWTRMKFKQSAGQDFFFFHSSS